MKSLNKISSTPIFPPLVNDVVFIDNKIRRQIDLLNQCTHSGVSLAATLKSAGMSYDDLLYVNRQRPTLRDNRYFTLDDFTERSNDIPVVSFFSGAGGLDLGLEAAGFSHSLLIEKVPLFGETIKLNRQNWDVQVGDVSNTAEMIEVVSSRIGNRNKFDGLFVGGPPCQPFSIASNQRFNKDGDNFKRIGFAHKTNGNLLFEYIALISHFNEPWHILNKKSTRLEVTNQRYIFKH